MQILKDMTICKDSSVAMMEEDAIVYSNVRGDILSVNVDAESSVSVVVEGINDNSIESWSPIAAIDLSKYAVVEKIEDSGIYEFGIEGLRKVRIYVDSISGGTATVHAMVVCSSD